MQLNELLTAYKHLPIVERMLETKDEALSNMVIILNKTIDGKLVYEVGGTKDFYSYTGAISSTIMLDSTYALISEECGCLEHYRKKQCVHTTLLYALALLSLSPSKFYEELEKYKRTKLALEQEIILTDLAMDLRTNASYFKRIHLTPEINREKNIYHLSLRIGYDKEYIVKSISEFIELMENKRYFSYGQKLSFVHSYEMLDDESKELYSFLLSICHEESLKSIVVKKSHFLKILEIYHQSGIYFSNEFLQTKFYSILDIEEMKIILDADSLHINIPSSTEQLVCGLNYAYFLGEEQILAYRYKKRNEAMIFNSLFKCNSNALWIEANETSFISNLLPLLKKDVIVESSFYEKYHLPEVSIVSYFHYKEGNIVNFPKIQVEEKYRNTPYVSQVLDGYSSLLESFGFYQNHQEEYFLDSVEAQYVFLTTDLSNLKNYGDVFFDQSMKRITLKKSTRVQVYVSYNVNLLDFRFESQDLTIEEIQAMLQAYHDKKRFVKLDNDVILEVKEEDARALDQFLEDFNLTHEPFSQVNSKPINYILKLVEGKDDTIHLDEQVYQMIDTIQNYKKSKILPDEEFLTVLRPYQIEGFQWLTTLAQFGFGGILADDMGLGKTLEIISFLSKDKVEMPTLIVCPMSLVYNWENECKKWNLKIPVRLIIGGALEREDIIQKIKEKEKAIYITSYDSLRRDIALYKCKFRSIVADEAQYIKNQNALKSTAIKQLQAELRFALTGTPIENGLADLWSIFDYLMPGYLSNYHHFKTRYEALIMEEDEEALLLLKKRVQPFILRRTKKDVLSELPEKTEEVYYCKMEGKQEEIYQTYIEKIKNDLQESGNQVLSLITRLRQICITPQLFYDEDISSAKLNLAIELITQAISSNHRILLFSQFSSVFPILAPMLEAENISYFILDGSTSAQRRIELVHQFNKDNKIKVFMISLKAGGTGLNLIGADMVLHLDPWWNVSAENQATDRAYRIGQTKNVHVIKLVCMNTIEEKVMLLQHLKSKLAEQILLNKETRISLTKEDILELIS
ncbi:MAG: DEAD/DEAH box helicase [Anaeroplasmataceae bacterium]|nr:DEAD/DEAH box helicase [Anaeroplasmataceae bacterium]